MAAIRSTKRGTGSQTRPLVVPLTAEEREAIKACAKGRGVKVATVVREAALMLCQVDGHWPKK